VVQRKGQDLRDLAEMVINGYLDIDTAAWVFNNIYY
jgi:hypothetical protein